MLSSRARGALQAMQTIEATVLQQEKVDQQDEIARVQEILGKTLTSFRPDPRVDSFMSQFEPGEYGTTHRHLSLGLFGGSQIGKTQKGVSLFGLAQSFKVNCQGLGPGGIPSIAGFNRAKHRCIIWDEVRPDQVLGNKEVFQSGAHLVNLGQSQCNQHSYSKWLYGIAHVLCSNCFPMTVQEGLSMEDAEWLNKNVMPAVLPEGQKWFFETSCDT